jgi:hypothetical protein
MSTCVSREDQLELYRVCPYRLGNVTAVERLVLFVQNVWDIQASYVEYLVCDVAVSIYKIKIYYACSSDIKFKCLMFTVFNHFSS